MKAAELFVKSLENLGVEYIFGVPGEENLRLLDEIGKSSKITFITTRDEQGAVFMAATVGRLTGKVGVALSTLGPGATNLVTGVAYAHLAGIPLLVITGQKPIKRSKQGRFQIIDVVRMMEPITKMAKSIVSGDRIPATLYEAVKTAEAERPGAVHIEFAEDIAEEETTAQPITWRKVRRPGPDPKAIEETVKLLKEAKHPVLLIGSGANRKRIHKHLHQLIEKLGIPFITSQMGKGVEDESLPHYLGTTTLSDGDYVHKMLQQSDLILLIGHDVNEKPPFLLNPDKKIVHINFYPATIDEVYIPTYELVGDIAHSLWAIQDQLEPQKDWDFSYFYSLKEKYKEQLKENVTSDSFPLKPQRIVSELRECLPRDGILALDNGMYKLWISRNYPAYEQNTVLLDNALATMGAGLPVGMASKLLYPEKKVVSIAGDGGFLMNVAELETAVRLSLDLVVVIINDSEYGMIRWKQEDMQLKDFGLNFNNPDFVKLAESFGAKGYKVTSAGEFKTTLQKALNEKGVHIIDTPVDYSENIAFFSKKLKEEVANL
jgi:acetolactate synthase-1/2/3 large subunit